MLQLALNVRLLRAVKAISGWWKLNLVDSESLKKNLNVISELTSESLAEQQFKMLFHFYSVCNAAADYN
jgi:hypothetical protein